MRIFPKLVGTLVVLGGPLLCLPALAQTNASAAEGAAAEAGVQSGARLAGIFEGDCSKVRTKGVGAVQHPMTGVCCIKPRARTHIDVAKAVPIVTVEWGLSSGNDLLAFHNSSRNDCPAGFIEVRRYDLVGNTTDRAAFSLVVP